MINFNNTINFNSISFTNFSYFNNVSSYNLNFNFSANNIDLANINPNLINNFNNINNLPNLLGSNIGFLIGSILGGNVGLNIANQNNFNPYQNLSSNSINNTLLLTLLLLLIQLLMITKQGNCCNSFPGQFPGSFPGQFPGGFPGQFPGSFPGQFPGGFPGQFPGGFPNNFPGGLGAPHGHQNNPNDFNNPIKGNGSASDFVRIAMSQVGKQYIFGAEANPNDPNPRAFDCSELVEWAVKRAGGNIVDGAANQFNYCRQHGTVISVQQALRTPGALLFYRNLGHVMISLGDGRVVEAGNSRVGVVVRPASVHGSNIAYGALVPGLRY
jgi:hypothetical protein